MPSLLDQRIDERLGITRDRLTLEKAIDRRLGIAEEPAIINPEAERKKIEDVIDIADETELPIRDVESNYSQIMAAPEDSRLSQLFQRYIRDPITEKTGLFPYVTDFGDPRRSELSISEHLSELKSQIPAAALHIIAERISGLGLSAPDILAQEFDRYVLDSEKPVTSLSELAGKITNLQDKGELDKAAQITGQLMKFMGGLKTARKILGPLWRRLPVRESLRFMFGTGVELGGVSLTQEVADKITKGEDINWGTIHKSAGWGVLVGGAESLVGKLAQYKDVNEVLKYEPRLKIVPRRILNKVAEAGRARAGGMSKKAWMKVYGKDMRKFIDHLRVISEQPALPGKVAVAPTVKPAEKVTVKPVPKAEITPKKVAPVAEPTPKGIIVPPKAVTGKAEGGIRADQIEEQTGIRLIPGVARRTFNPNQTIEQRRQVLREADFAGEITNPERLRAEKVLDILQAEAVTGEGIKEHLKSLSDKELSQALNDTIKLRAGFTDTTDKFRIEETDRRINLMQEEWTRRGKAPTPTEVKPDVKFETAKPPEQPEATGTLTDDQSTEMLSDEMPLLEKAKESLQGIADAARRAHDWIFAFGEAKRTMPELYDKLMSSFGKRNAGIEKSISEIEKVIGPEGLNPEDASELATIFEDKRLSPPENLKEVYDRFSKLFAEIEKTSQAEGIFEKPFQERMLEEINGQIETELLKLRSTGKGDSKKLKELLAEEETIKNMRYLPHNIVAQKAIEAKLSTLTGKPRRTFLENLKRVSSKFKKREGRLFLKDYMDARLLEPKDIDIRKLAAEALADYYYRSSIKSLYDFADEQGLIKPASDELRKEGWMTAKEAGILAPELKNKMVHPLFGSSLNELQAMRHRKGGLIRRTLGMIKIGQFVKPWIIWIYNTVQKYMRGMYSFNPASEAEAATEAIKAVMNETELYHKLNESNLFQFPYEVSRASRNEQINMMLRRTIADKKSWEKAIVALEKTTGTSWATQDVDIRKALMVFYQSIARATWTGDKIQRTQSYLMLRRMGYPHDEAVKVASNAHGAYSILSKKYKETLSPLLFVYSFRILMPMEMVKTALEPVIGIAEAAFKRQGIPKHKAKRWAKAVIATIAVPVLVDQYMKARGFKKEGAHLGPLAWKYKKTILNPDTGREEDIVVGMNYILNMPVKYWQRITYYNPIRPEARWQQSIEHLIKWEIHPLWRIFFWDIADNRKSFGSGIQVYDTEANPMEQAGQIAKYVFGQSLRFWGGMMDAVGEGSMTEKERASQKVIFEEGLTKLDRVLFSVLGYKYTRSNLDERKTIMGKFLLKETKSRAFNIARKYEGEEKDKRVADLEKWARRCQKWIETEMK